MNASTADSRDYIVAFELRSADDCPGDFDLDPGLANFDAGLFLPRDDPDWFGRSSYPPHVLLVTRDRLHIIAHPRMGGSASEFPIERISCVESGCALLKGWLCFLGPGLSYTVSYNTRGFRSVARFMSRFRERLLGAAGAPSWAETPFRPELDMKFDFAFRRELDAGEQVLAQLFQPPQELRLRKWLFPRARYRAGDLVVLTGRRLLWITDRDRGLYSRYGSVVSYAPLRAVQTVEKIQSRDNCRLIVSLSGSTCWQIPVSSANMREAENFLEAVAVHKEPDATAYTQSRGQGHSPWR